MTGFPAAMKRGSANTVCTPGAIIATRTLLVCSVFTGLHLLAPWTLTPPHAQAAERYIICPCSVIRRQASRQQPSAAGDLRPGLTFLVDRPRAGITATSPAPDHVHVLNC